MKLTAQQMQDNIFKGMSADRKLEVGSGLWRCAKELVGDKLINYDGDGTKRSEASFGKYSQNS